MFHIHINVRSRYYFSEAESVWIGFMQAKERVQHVHGVRGILLTLFDDVEGEL